MVDLLLAFSIALASGQRSDNPPNLAAELAHAKRVGMCTSTAELKAKFSFPRDRDAGPIYLRILTLTTRDIESVRAFSQLLSPGRKPRAGEFLDAAKAVEGSAPGNAKYANDIGLIAGLGRNPTPEQTKAADRAVQELNPIYTLAAQAADRPHCSLVGYYGAPDMSFPILAGLKAITKCLAYRARRRAELGDWRGALLDVRTMKRTGIHAAEYPTFIGMFGGIAIDSIGERLLDDFIDRKSHDVEWLSKAMQLSDDTNTLPNLKHIVIGEYLQSLLLLSTPPTDPSTRALTVKVLGRWRALYKAIPEDPKRWQDVYPAARKLAREGMSDPSTKELTLDYPSILDAVAKTVARRRLTGTALRILLYRSRSGRLPDLLPNYGPMGVDPFTAKPLKYLRKGSGFLLYSVGADRIDNGGKGRVPGAASDSSGYDETLQIH